MADTRHNAFGGRVNEAASASHRGEGPHALAWGSTGNCESTLAADTRHNAFGDASRRPRRGPLDIASHGPRA